jgi:hypothetical protein
MIETTYVGNCNKIQSIISKIISLWMIIVSTTIIILSKYANDEQKELYRFGPNEKLNILGFIINTREKYILIISYCFLNSIFRTLYNSILHSWLINNIQDDTKSKDISIKIIAYEITIVTTIYNWFDWFIYINILLSQIDMVIIEIIADLFVSLITTSYYLRNIITQIEYIPIYDNIKIKKNNIFENDNSCNSNNSIIIL